MAESKLEMASLRELNVADNKYYREHPELIAELRELEKFSISYSRSTVKYFPLILPNPDHLQCLDIGYFNLDQFPEVITQAATLQELVIHGN